MRLVLVGGRHRGSDPRTNQPVRVLRTERARRRPPDASMFVPVRQRGIPALMSTTRAIGSCFHLRDAAGLDAGVPIDLGQCASETPPPDRRDDTQRIRRTGVSRQAPGPARALAATPLRSTMLTSSCRTTTPVESSRPGSGGHGGARLRWAGGRRAGLRGTGYEQDGRDGGYGHPFSYPHESSTQSCRVSFREIGSLGS